MYHDILTNGDPYTITKEQFKQQMALVNELNYHAISVSDFLSIKDQKNLRETKEFGLTFDDGYANNYIYCLPELEKYNFRATFFITTSLIDLGRGFSKEQIYSLSEKDMEIGSHTVNHAFLPNLPDHALRFELEESKRQLEDIINKPVLSLSLPGGRGNKKILKFAHEAGYKSICTSVYHPNDENTDPFSLGRVPIKRNYSLELFEKIVIQDKRVWKSMKFKQDMKYVIQRILGNKLYDSIWKLRYE
ncbi:MAG: polysaccharide deacetylase family protein [Candidatus Cloacimonetes bacterium]|nr:polysaccharide deacetylase family protein [Candidatus Cloacimonadota bacterium]